MSEPESKPLKLPLAERSELFEKINAVAISQAVEPDPLALKDQEDLDKDYPDSLSHLQRARDEAEIAHLTEETRQERLVNRTRLILLGCLFVLISLWIVSVVALTTILGFRYGDLLCLTW